jgi:hypothetical protein
MPAPEQNSRASAPRIAAAGEGGRGGGGKVTGDRAELLELLELLLFTPAWAKRVRLDASWVTRSGGRATGAEGSASIRDRTERGEGGEG